MKYLMNKIHLVLVLFTLILGLVVPSAAPVKAGTIVANLETGDGGYRGYGMPAANSPGNNITAADNLYTIIDTNVYESKASDLDQAATSGIPWAWGRNLRGALGDGTTTSSSIPVQVSNLSNVIAIAGGEYHSLALRSDGTAWAWGDGSYGQLGNSSIYSQYTPVQMSNLSNVIAIASGNRHSLAVKSDGTAWACGYNVYGQLGNGDTGGGVSTPVQVSNLSGVTAVAGGEDYSLALKSDGTVWAWGKNWFGQLGNGTTTSSSIPVQVVGLGGVTAIAAGGAHSLALKSDGTVWAWGNGTYGQLGNGTDTGSTTPVKVSNLSAVTAIAGGSRHSLALKSDGTVWDWGYNKYGQLGDDTTTDQYTPVQVSGLSGVTAIAGDLYHSLAINSSGSAFAWGYNIFGQLGDGTTTERHTPVLVNNLSDVIAVAGGMYHSLAIKGVKKPDLVITDVWNEDGYIHYQIRNIGDATAPKGHHTLLLIDDTELAENLIDVELGVGERLKDSFGDTWQCSQLEDTIKVCADNRDAISESDETNNCREETWKCDSTPPDVTAVPTVSGITQSSATISWSTDEDSSSVVQYSKGAGMYVLEAEDTNLVTDHVIILDNLEASSIYNYIVKSTDNSGNTMASAGGFFETEPLSDSESPVLTGLTATRSATDFLCYDVSVDASDDIGISKVEFYLDDMLIGTDYSEPYEYKLDPLTLGMSRESFFNNDHELEAIAFDLSGTQTQHTTVPSWASEPVPIQLEVWPNHHITRFVDGPSAGLPSDTTIDICAHTYEYERVPVWAGGELLGFNEVEQAVHHVTFDPSNGGMVSRSLPDAGSEYDYSYSWNVSYLTVGTYSIEIEAHAHDGSVKRAIRYLYVEEGEPRLDVSRVVSRVDNYFQIELIVENLGDATTQIDKIKDNVDHFQPLRKRVEYRGYEVSTNSSYSEPGVYTNVDIDLFTDTGGDAVILAPGENVTVEYLAVPILYADSVDYGIGLSDVEVYHPDGSVESFDRPCSLTSDGSTLSSAIEAAKAGSDFLVITNAERLFTLFTQDDAGNVLSAMAELARLKNGILGYVPGRNKNTVHDTIKDWGVGMTGSDGVAGNYLRSGYLLLVGESEIIGSWTVYIDGYDDVLYSDLPYANTEGEFRNPELIVGRVIGNDPDELIVPIQASVNVYKGEPDFEWDRTQALVVSGRGEGVSHFEDDADEIADILNDEFTVVTTLKQREIEDAGGNITAEFKAHDSGRDVIVFRDHGWPTSWSGVLVPGDFRGTDAVDFGTSKPFAFAICCYAGRYEDEDIDGDGNSEGESGIAEAFQGHGAVVYIGATQVSKRDSNGAAGEDFFDRWIGSTDSVGKAFRNLKRNFNSTRRKRYWISEYNLYGDPKYGSATTVAPDTYAMTIDASEPQTSLDIVIPDYNVSITSDNTDYLRIPGGDMIIEEDRPMVPYYTARLDYPQGQRVQDVILTDRSGLTTATGLNIPNASLENDRLMVYDSPSGNDESWWPEEAFVWEVCENADGSSTLIIEMYPFYYNPLTTDVKFYKNYSFDIQVTESTAEIKSLDTDSTVYSQGDNVLIDLWINNLGDAQDLIVSAVVTADSSGEPVDGLLLQTLKGLTGTVSFSPEWDSSGFGPGYYYIDVTLRNTAGMVLDRRMEMFNLGIHSGEITDFTAAPQNVNIGDSIDISLDFTNTGTVDISGNAIVKVQNETGDIVEEFSSDITDLSSGNSVNFDYIWDTSGTETGSYSIIGYVLFDSEATEPMSIIVAVNPVSPPYTPVNITPANGATWISLTPGLEASAFSDPDGDTHVASQWQLTTVSGDYSSPLFDSGADSSNLTSITVPGGVLDFGTTYYWHVRYQDSHLVWSEWSEGTGFLTEPEFVIPGDANGDSVINIFDITKVVRIILLMDDETPGADANEDGSVNIFDMTKIARIIRGLD